MQFEITERCKVAKIIIPVVTVAMTAGLSGAFASMIKKVTPILATVKR